MTDWDITILYDSTTGRKSAAKIIDSLDLKLDEAIKSVLIDLFITLFCDDINYPTEEEITIIRACKIRKDVSLKYENIMLQYRPVRPTNPKWLELKRLLWIFDVCYAEETGIYMKNIIKMSKSLFNSFIQEKK